MCPFVFFPLSAPFPVQSTAIARDLWLIPYAAPNLRGFSRRMAHGRAVAMLTLMGATEWPCNANTAYTQMPDFDCLQDIGIIGSCYENLSLQQRWHEYIHVWHCFAKIGQFWGLVKVWVQYKFPYLSVIVDASMASIGISPSTSCLVFTRRYGKNYYSKLYEIAPVVHYLWQTFASGSWLSKSEDFGSF